MTCVTTGHEWQYAFIVSIKQSTLVERKQFQELNYHSDFTLCNPDTDFCLSWHPKKLLVGLLTVTLLDSSTDQIIGLQVDDLAIIY